MPPSPVQLEDVRLSDFTGRLCTRPIRATTAMYGPWTADGQFDWDGYTGLVRDVLAHDAVPATNVDTTWAQYNTWDLARQIIAETARVARDFEHSIAPDRPLLVVGLNTNPEQLAPRQIAPSIRLKAEEIAHALRQIGVDRVRYMPVPDRRLLGAPRKVKVETYREIGKALGEFTDYGMVFFELDIGIPDFGSDFDLDDVAEILAAVPQIQEYKSAVIAAKPGRWAYDYDFRDDIARIMLVERVAAGRVQFSTGNDWCIALARCGANLPRFGYLLGASQISPALFQRWTTAVEADDPAAVAIEQDLQAAARDFWTPGNVGVYRHYIAILLALTGRIASPAPHPSCDAHFRVRPEDYWRPLKHALRLGLLDRQDALLRARQHIPPAAEMLDSALMSKLRLLG